MPSVMPLLLLSSISLLTMATILALTILFLRQSRSERADLVKLHEKTLLLLASRDVQAFEQLQAATNPPSPAYSPPDRYYTGDAQQVEDERLKGTLNDDDLTAIYGFGG